jgi:hypothetical protein
VSRRVSHHVESLLFSMTIGSEAREVISLSLFVRQLAIHKPPRVDVGIVLTGSARLFTTFPGFKSKLPITITILSKDPFVNSEAVPKRVFATVSCSTGSTSCPRRRVSLRRSCRRRAFCRSSASFIRGIVSGCLVLN